jgi:hypothetical protein
LRWLRWATITAGAAHAKSVVVAHCRKPLNNPSVLPLFLLIPPCETRRIMLVNVV